MTGRPRLRRALLLLGGALVLLAVGGACLTALASQPRPAGTAGADAEALTDAMWAAVDRAAWERTGAVRWRLRDGRPLHLWDRTRQLVEVTYDEESPPVRVLMDLATRRGVAFRGPALVPDGELGRWLERAYADWANDSFWLAAPFKARDPGTAREVVDVEAQRGLLVAYSSGGVTPGDAYLWELDERQRPVAWRMWVKIIPVGGLRLTWEEWTELPTGAWIARTHKGPFDLTLRLDPLEGAETLEGLVGDADPFAPLLAPSR